MAPACADTDDCNCHLADARLLTRGATVLCGGGFTDRDGSLRLFWQTVSTVGTD